MTGAKMRWFLAGSALSVKIAIMVLLNWNVNGPPFLPVSLVTVIELCPFIGVGVTFILFGASQSLGAGDYTMFEWLVLGTMLIADICLVCSLFIKKSSTAEVYVPNGNRS